MSKSRAFALILFFYLAPMVAMDNIDLLEQMACKLDNDDYDDDDQTILTDELIEQVESAVLKLIAIECQYLQYEKEQRAWEKRERERPLTEEEKEHLRYLNEYHCQRIQWPLYAKIGGAVALIVGLIIAINAP